MADQNRKIKELETTIEDMQASFERLSQNFESIRHPSVFLNDLNEAELAPMPTETDQALPVTQQHLEAEKFAEIIKQNLPSIKPIPKKRNNRIDKFPELKQAFDRLISEYSRSRRTSKASLELRQSCKLKLEQEATGSEKALKSKLHSPRKIIKKCAKRNLR